MNFRKTPATNSSPANDGSLGLDYWPAEVSKNLLFAVPTAVVVVSERVSLYLCVHFSLILFISY